MQFKSNILIDMRKKGHTGREKESQSVFLCLCRFEIYKNKFHMIHKILGEA